MAFPLLTHADAQRASNDATTARFAARPREVGRRHNPNVDAGWWPRSSNLTVELAHLLRAAHEAGFSATRVAYRLNGAWTAPPRRVVFGTRHVKVSGYHNHQRDMITLIDGASHERLQVLAVPPDTAVRLAERALRIAVADADPTPDAHILALAVRAGRTGVSAG
jgi:hypothetical protein